MHLAQEGEDLLGLVAVTNAEKVILNHINTDIDANWLSQDELDKQTLANELRSIIGSLYIDIFDMFSYSGIWSNVCNHFQACNLYCITRADVLVRIS